MFDPQISDMKIYVKISLHIFLLSGFNRDFIIFIKFTLIAASNAEIDDVTN